MSCIELYRGDLLSFSFAINRKHCRFCNVSSIRAVRACVRACVRVCVCVRVCDWGWGWTNSFQNQADGEDGEGGVELANVNQADFNRKHRLHP